MNPGITTTLPTEPGKYLFYGYREVGGLHLELVRVGLNASGDLLYIGSDVFWKPSKARGAWVRVDGLATDLKDQATRLVLDELVPSVLDRWVARDWPLTMAVPVELLAESLKYTRVFEDPTVLADHAVAKGWLVREDRPATDHTRGNPMYRLTDAGRAMVAELKAKAAT